MFLVSDLFNSFVVLTFFLSLYPTFAVLLHLIKLTMYDNVYTFFPLLPLLVLLLLLLLGIIAGYVPYVFISFHTSFIIKITIVYLPFTKPHIIGYFR